MLDKPYNFYTPLKFVAQTLPTELLGILINSARVISCRQISSWHSIYNFNDFQFSLGDNQIFYSLEIYCFSKTCFCDTRNLSSMSIDVYAFIHLAFCPEKQMRFVNESRREWSKSTSITVVHEVDTLEGDQRNEHR